MRRNAENEGVSLQVRSEHSVIGEVKGGWGGFTLIEVLVVISVISLLLSILVPVIGNVRAKARNVVKISNMRNITLAVSSYSVDNRFRYPITMGTIGFGERFWNYSDPRRLTTFPNRVPGAYRAMSSYLGGYIEDASVFHCPNAPKKYKYLQALWDAGDEWGKKESDPVYVTGNGEAFIGTYSFYWDYAGYLSEGVYFLGPSRSDARPGRSKLLMSDYFGKDHWRTDFPSIAGSGFGTGGYDSTVSYGSCERMRGARKTAGSLFESDYWVLDKKSYKPVPDIVLHGAYVDGSVRSYRSTDTVAMNIINRYDGSKYKDILGGGGFYLPIDAFR